MTISRRDFLDFLTATCAAAAIPNAFTSSAVAKPANIAATRRAVNDSEAIVNDIHSQLNRTSVSRILRPLSLNDLRSTILTGRSERKAISIAGGRHAMGGQQFGTGTTLVDMTGMN